MAPQIRDGFAEAAIRLHEALIDLRVEPLLECLHNRPTISLVVCQALGGVHLLHPCLFLVVEHLLERLDDDGALLGPYLLQLAELAPAVRQTVTADQCCFIHGVRR